MATIHRTIKNIAAIFFGDVLSRMLAMVTTVIIARHFGPSDYGKFTLVLSFAYIFVSLSEFGLNDLFIREIALDRSRASKYFAASLIIKPMLSFVGMLLYILAVYLMDYSQEIIIYTVIFSTSLIFTTLTNSIMTIFRAYENMMYSAFITIMSAAVVLIFTIIIISLNGSLTHIFISRVVALIAGFIIAYILLANNLVKPQFSLSIIFLKGLIARAAPFLAVIIIHALYLKVDIIMLSKMKGELYVGWYVPAANDLFFALFLIPGSIAAVIYPIFSRQYGESIEKLRSSCNFTIKVLTVIGVAISIGTIVLAFQIIHLIYGQQYDNSVIVLQIIAIAISFVFIKEILDFGLAAAGQIKKVMWLNVITLGLNVILNLIFIPRYAHIGAAIVAVVCIISSSIMSYYILNKEIKGIHVIENYGKPIIAALVMSVVIYLLNSFNLFLIIFIGAIIYIALIFILRTFNTSELYTLKKVVVKNDG